MFLMLSCLCVPHGELLRVPHGELLCVPHGDLLCVPHGELFCVPHGELLCVPLFICCVKSHDGMLLLVVRCCVFLCVFLFWGY